MGLLRAGWKASSAAGAVRPYLFPPLAEVGPPYKMESRTFVQMALSKQGMH